MGSGVSILKIKSKALEEPHAMKGPSRQHLDVITVSAPEQGRNLNPGKLPAHSSFLLAQPLFSLLWSPPTSTFTFQTKSHS